MKLTFLGTRGNIEARTRRHRMHTSLRISYRGKSVLVDCGEDWTGRLPGLAPRAIVSPTRTRTMPAASARALPVRSMPPPGATVTRSMVRRRGENPIGHAPVRTQLTWCGKEGVPRAIITHCGSEIVEGDERKLGADIRKLARERGVEAEIATGGMEVILRQNDIMPELPDVEVFRRYLDSTALHQPVRRTRVLDETVLEDVTPQMIQSRLKGRALESTRRHGKQLLVRTDGGDWLALHFGMTGFLRYYRDEEEAPPHVRLLLHFDDGYRLAYDCQRKFGKVAFAEDAEAFLEKKGLGPDALDLDREGFRAALAGRRGRIKSALMNQSILAGVGNVYSDGALFRAGIYPERKVTDLSDDAVGELFDALRETLTTAIDSEVDPERFPADAFLPHRKQGATCPRCGAEIEKIRVSGRGAYVCPVEQER